MIVELISTGSELLLGDTINTNAAWLAREFNRLGYSVTHQTTIGDNSQRMCDSFIAAAGRADIVVSTGGLGPTQGDITRDSLAIAVGSELVKNEMARCEVEEFFKKRKREVPPASEREMMALPDSTILHNSCGVAPGIAYYDDATETTFILLPGPPAEMKAVYTEAVVPYLQQHFGNQGVVLSERYAVYGYRELALENMFIDLVKSQSNPTIAFLIKNGYIELRITAHGESKTAAELLLAPWKKYIEGRIPTDRRRSLTDNIEETVAKVLLVRQGTVATAESCTAGLVGKRLTNLPGSSAYFMGGILSYSNDVKARLLEVPEEMLVEYGAVSEQVAKAMAEGTRRSVGTTYGISITGIAGPGGGTAEKPVGLVWFGVSGPNGTRAFRNDFIGNRESIRQSAAEYALHCLLVYMQEERK